MDGRVLSTTGMDLEHIDGRNFASGLPVALLTCWGVVYEGNTRAIAKLPKGIPRCLSKRLEASCPVQDGIMASPTDGSPTNWMDKCCTKICVEDTCQHKVILHVWHSYFRAIFMAKASLCRSTISHWHGLTEMIWLLYMALWPSTMLAHQEAVEWYWMSTQYTICTSYPCIR